MKLHSILLAAGLSLAAAPASAAVTVIGSTSARICYEAAEARHAGTGAIADCDEALREGNLTGEDRVATHVNRGILKLRGGRLDEAIADFDRAIALDAGEAEAYLNKGMALLRVTDGEKQAIGLFNTALAKKTRRPAIAHYGRAIAYELDGRIQEAYRDYRRASALEPKWREPRTELARFTVRQQ